MRPRSPTHRCLRALLSAGVAAVLLVASCLNPQPDDFPQSSNGSPPNARATTPGPSDVEGAPGAAAATAPAPQPPTNVDFGNEALPPGTSPPAEVPAPLAPEADAGVPGDAGPPDAAPVVAP